MRHLRDELAAAGLSPEEAERKSRLLAATRAVLDARGIGGPPRRYWVPGRVEVLGKHTDYAGGRGLLVARARGVVDARAAAGKPRQRQRRHRDRARAHPPPVLHCRALSAALSHSVMKLKRLFSLES